MMKVEMATKPHSVGLVTVPIQGARKPGIIPKMWSVQEDTLLRNAITKYGEKAWKLVAAEVPGRTYIQCLQRWKKALRPGLRKGHWSEEEDERLLDLIAQYKPNLDWATIAKQIEGRSAKQCRERWYLNLDPSINHGPWTAEEDHQLMEFVRLNGGKWSLIAKHMPGRTENSVKTRYYSLQRKEARRRQWTEDEDSIIIDSVLTYGRNFDILDKKMKHRTKGQIKKRFTWLIQRQPELLSQISSVEKMLRRKRKASEVQEPRRDHMLRTYSSSFKAEETEMPISSYTANDVAATLEPLQKKPHSMRKTVSTSILEDILKPDQIMPLNNLLEINLFNESEEARRHVQPRVKTEHTLRKVNSLEVLQNLLLNDVAYS